MDHEADRARDQVHHDEHHNYDDVQIRCIVNLAEVDAKSRLSGHGGHGLLSKSRLVVGVVGEVGGFGGLQVDGVVLKVQGFSLGDGRSRGVLGEVVVGGHVDR